MRRVLCRGQTMTPMCIEDSHRSDGQTFAIGTPAAVPTAAEVRPGDASLLRRALQGSSFAYVMNRCGMLELLFLPWSSQVSAAVPSPPWACL